MRPTTDLRVNRQLMECLVDTLLLFLDGSGCGYIWHVMGVAIWYIMGVAIHGISWVWLYMAYHGCGYTWYIMGVAIWYIMGVAI